MIEIGADPKADGKVDALHRRHVLRAQFERDVLIPHLELDVLVSHLDIQRVVTLLDCPDAVAADRPGLIARRS